MRPIDLPKGDRTRPIERLCDFLRALPTDKAYRVEIKRLVRTRSMQQNSYLWGCVYPEILAQGGEALGGWTAQDLHEYCLGEWAGWEVLEGFGRKRQRPVKRSSKLTTTEFMDYIAHIQQLMAGHGIYVPDPNEDVI